MFTLVKLICHGHPLEGQKQGHSYRPLMAWLFDMAINSDSSFVTIKSASDYIKETGKKRLEIQHGLLVAVRMLLAPEV